MVYIGSFWFQNGNNKLLLNMTKPTEKQTVLKVYYLLVKGTVEASLESNS